MGLFIHLDLFAWSFGIVSFRREALQLIIINKAWLLMSTLGLERIHRSEILSPLLFSPHLPNLGFLLLGKESIVIMSNFRISRLHRKKCLFVCVFSFKMKCVCVKKMVSNTRSHRKLNLIAKSEIPTPELPIFTVRIFSTFFDIFSKMAPTTFSFNYVYTFYSR